MMEFWLAPLHGITNFHFRNCLNRHVKNLSVAVTPFLPVGSTSQINVRRWADVAPENNRTGEVIPQLIGNQPTHFVDTIRELQKLGYQRFNWNIGCPAAQVVRKQRGCGIMPHPDRVEEVVRLVTQETDCHFSIKMRLGLKNPEEGMAILEHIQPYPLDFVAIHPRLGIQQYEGKPDFSMFRRMYDFTEQNLIYSGDIFDIPSYQYLVDNFPKVQRVMLGRGILRNPFLAEELTSGKTLSDDERKERFAAFYADYIQTMQAARGEHGALSILKELWHYFAHFCQLSPEALQELLRITDFKEFHERASTYIE